MLIDETGALLAPLVRRSLSPSGLTPVLRQRARHRDKVSVVAALALSPRQRRWSLYFRNHPGQYINHEKSATFLRQLLRHIRGPVIVVWDGGNMHRGPAVRAVLARHPRLWLERLPPYAPELNPVEHLWNHLKYVKLANFTPNSVTELNGKMHHHLSQVQRQPERLQCFIHASGLSFPYRKLLN